MERPAPFRKADAHPGGDGAVAADAGDQTGLTAHLFQYIGDLADR